MINEKEVDYYISLIQADIYYFTNYKKQLKKFAINNRADINNVKMNLIFTETENVTLHICNLKIQEQELLKLLDKIYYGNQDNN
jgi:hypothetical protein